MGNRLSKIVTRGGDKGETSLGDGARIAKTDPRIHLLGEVDELNSWIGVVLAHAPGETVAATLVGVQHDLFDLGGALCFPGAPVLSDAHVARIDDAAAALNEDLPPLKEFILPGGAPLLAWLHVARTVCRRAERCGAAFLSGDLSGEGQEALSDEAQEAGKSDAAAGGFGLIYLNRLSDYLFIAARFEAKRLGAAENLWRKAHSVSGAGEGGD